MKTLGEVLAFYSSPDTYRKRPSRKLCTSLWHETGHSVVEEAHHFHSTCPTCRGTSRRMVQRYEPAPIEEDGGVLAREYVAEQSLLQIFPVMDLDLTDATLVMSSAAVVHAPYCHPAPEGPSRCICGADKEETNG